MSETKTFTSADAGCFFDSHRGHYIIPAIIEFAREQGRDLDDRTTDLVAQYDRDWSDDTYPYDHVIEESDAAIGWLNDNRRPDGFWWGWNDGDFGLYPLENDDDDV